MKVFDIKENDAVFVPSFTFYSTSEVVSLEEGATPINIGVAPSSNETTSDVE